MKNKKENIKYFKQDIKQENKFNNVIHGNTKLFQAVVVNITNKQVQILFEGSIIPCLIPGSLISRKNSLVVGDKVEIGLAGNNQYKLVRILPRKTALLRGDRRLPGEEIIVAANVQYLLVIVTADYLINQSGYPEAAVISAMRSGIEVGLFISKCDLIGERAQALLRDKLTLYHDLADAVFVGTAHEIEDKLIQTVKGKTTVVIGDRACGKTTVVHRILSSLQGNDTCHKKIPSTHASILQVGSDEAYLIDTPGFRDLALHQITEEERNSVFPEIAMLKGKCDFTDCTHVHEEGCQVIEALRAGKIKRERYDAYQKMAGITPETSNRKNGTPRVDYRKSACMESFVCKICGTLVVPDGAASHHRNHCPNCLSSVHVDNEPGDRASLCNGIMDPVSVWVRKGGEWAIIHRCRLCGTFSSNRIAADDNPMLLMSIAVKPLSMPPFPLNNLTSL